MVTFLRFVIWFVGWALVPLHRKWRPGMPIGCLVVGYGGADNTGAEARTSEAIRQMLDADPRIEITLTSLDRDRTLRYLHEDRRLKIVEINPVFVYSILRLILISDIVVLVEGSCFKENFSPALLWFFLYTAGLAQKFGLPSIAYGVDAGLLSKKNQRWARTVADNMDLLMVRTAAAKQVLHSIGVERDIVVTTDTAFTMAVPDKHWAEAEFVREGIDLKRPIMGIAFEEFFWWPVVPSLWRAIKGQKEDRYKSIYYHSWGANGKTKSRVMKEQVAMYADWAAKEHRAQVVMFAMERLDIGACRDVQTLMKSPSILIESAHANAQKMAALLRRLDWLVTCRYHALVMAMGGHVPTIGLAHDERIAAILDELGLIDDAFVFYEEDQVAGLLIEKTKILRSDAGRFSRAIERSMPNYLARAAENGRLFGELVKSKFPQ